MYNLDLEATKLDITAWKGKGADLIEAIEKEIKPIFKSKLILPIPSIIIMTQAQYDDLMRLAKLPNMFHSKDQMLQTKYNVMEVRVKDRRRPTIEEAENMSVKELKGLERMLGDE